MFEVTIQTIDQLPEAAKKLMQTFSDKRVFAFFGAMGAGKTTFIKTICTHLSVVEPTSSPTFSLVNEYRSATHQSIYHFDFYRIRKIEEAIDMGVEEYLYSGNYCFIEWPENIAPLLPENTIAVKISTENEMRLIQAFMHTHTQA
ncbi:MAG: tRNA (adenosine(37)-N6)-threonylcarbamoyltransferase complex ATPase subunit type 1 TsaE [Bacteroidia bacterium]